MIIEFFFWLVVVELLDGIGCSRMMGLLLAAVDEAGLMMTLLDDLYILMGFVMLPLLFDWEINTLWSVEIGSEGTSLIWLDPLMEYTGNELVGDILHDGVVWDWVVRRMMEFLEEPESRWNMDQLKSPEMSHSWNGKVGTDNSRIRCTEQKIAHLHRNGREMTREKLAPRDNIEYELAFIKGILVNTVMEIKNTVPPRCWDIMWYLGICVSFDLYDKLRQRFSNLPL